jgi:hypothetical protein
MARRASDVAAAKQARQKKIAIGGFVVLLGVLAISVPRTMKMLDRGQAAAPAAQPSVPAAPAPGTPAATPAADAILVDTGAGPAPASGQLTTFERFESKDPFAQQVDPTPRAASPSSSAPPVAEPAPAQPTAGVVPAATRAPRPAPAPPAAAPAPAPAPARAPEPTAAVIAVNGVRETVNLRAAFPAADKVFELRSVGEAEVKVGIAGGSLTGGATTVTLKRGKKVTLVNTADGTRYELVLVSTA